MPRSTSRRSNSYRSKSCRVRAHKLQHRHSGSGMLTSASKVKKVTHKAVRGRAGRESKKNPGQDQIHEPQPQLRSAIVIGSRTWVAPQANLSLKECDYSVEDMEDQLRRRLIFIVKVWWSGQVVARELGDLTRCRVVVGMWKPEFDPRHTVRRYYYRQFIEHVIGGNDVLSSLNIRTEASTEDSTISEMETDSSLRPDLDSFEDSPREDLQRSVTPPPRLDRSPVNPEKLLRQFSFGNGSEEISIEELPPFSSSDSSPLSKGLRSGPISPWSNTSSPPPPPPPSLCYSEPENFE